MAPTFGGGCRRLDDEDYPEPIVDHASEREEALRRYRADQLVTYFLMPSPASTGNEMPVMYRPDWPQR